MNVDLPRLTFELIYLSCSFYGGTENLDFLSTMCLFEVVENDKLHVHVLSYCTYIGTYYFYFPLLFTSTPPHLEGLVVFVTPHLLDNWCCQVHVEARLRFCIKNMW